MVETNITIILLYYCTCSVDTSDGLSTAESTAPGLLPLPPFAPGSSDERTGRDGHTGAQAQTTESLSPVLKSAEESQQ